MLAGIVSDTHDNLPMTAKAVEVLTGRGVDIILHCGDFVAPFTLKMFAELPIPFTCIYGNNDGEKAGLAGVYPEIREGPLRLEINGRSVVIAHDPEDLYPALSEDTDLGLCGHTHRPKIESGSTLIVNPGEVCGWVTGRCTVALADLDNIGAELIELGMQRRSFQ